MEAESPNFVCCERCFENIAGRHGGWALVWIELCHEYLRQEQPLRFKSKRSLALEYLEKHDYIVSHETADDILVRVNGFHYAEVDGTPRDFFCINPYDHCELINED